MNQWLSDGAYSVVEESCGKENNSGESGAAILKKGICRQLLLFEKFNLQNSPKASKTLRNIPGGRAPHFTAFFSLEG
jgi:hypothetical protein